MSENRVSEEPLVLVYPLAKSRYFKEGICAAFILLIIWVCIVISPTIVIIKSGEKITASDFEFLCLIGFIVLICSLVCLWWLYTVFKGHRLTANSESYCMSVSKNELVVGIALLVGRSHGRLIRNNQLSLKFNWSQIKNLELSKNRSGDDSGHSQIIISVEDAKSPSGIQRYFIERWYLGNREKELLNEIQAHLIFPIKDNK